MSLLTICQNAAVEININPPTAIISNTDADAVTLLRAVNKGGWKLAKATDWPVLRKAHTFTGISGETQTGILPSDFDRIVPGTFFINDLVYTGPISPVDWGSIGASSDTSRYVFAYRGGNILVRPALSSGETVEFEYISSKWALAVDGATYKTSMTVDTDTGVIEEELLTMATVVEYLRIKKLDFAHQEAELKRMADQVFTNAGGYSFGDVQVADIFGDGARSFDGYQRGSGS